MSKQAGFKSDRFGLAAIFDLPPGASFRFSREREKDFRVTQDFRYKWLRVIFFAACAISWLAGVLLNDAVFAVTGEYQRTVLLIELVWAVPVLTLAAVMPLIKRSQKWVYPSNVAGTMTLWGSVLTMHALAHLGALQYPMHMLNIAVMAIAFFGGFRFKLMLLGSTITMTLGVLVVGLGEQSSYPLSLYLYETAYFWIIVVGGLLSFELLNRSSFLYREYITELAETDVLTGLMNRRAFERMYSRAVGQAARDRKTIAVALIDLDHFKHVNDHYGHPVGDEVLRRTGEVLKQWPCIKRSMDMQARYGGEEFTVVWFDVRSDAAELMGERILQAIRSIQFQASPDKPEIKLTASVGIAVGMPSSQTDNENYLRLADEALYEAKERGRDQFIIKPLASGAH